MNLHLAAHFPIVPVVAAGVGVVLVAIGAKRAYVVELGKALLWAGSFAALFSAAGSC